METIATPTTSAPDPVERRPCLRCGAPTRTVRLGFETLPFVQNRWCDECIPLVEAEDVERDRQRHVARFLSMAGGDRMRSWSLDTYPRDPDAARARRDAVGWLDTLTRRQNEATDVRFVDGPNLLLFGSVGAGKTGLAWALVRALCEEEVEARLVNFREYLWDVRRSFKTQEPVDDRPHLVPVLALDDLGSERPTDFAREELATLVERRSRTGRPTIVTSNYDPAELIHRLGHDDRVVGERIVSRLVEAAVQVRFTGRDRRLAA